MFSLTNLTEFQIHSSDSSSSCFFRSRIKTVQTQFEDTIEISNVNLRQKKTLSAIKQLINVLSFEWEFTESAGAKSSCRITRGSSIFIVPWKRERKRRGKKTPTHPWLVTVTNRGYYTLSKFFFPGNKPEDQERRL